MALLTLLTEPDKRLRKRSSPIQHIQCIQSYIPELIDTLVHEKGLAIAAPQVNIHDRVIVMDLSLFSDLSPSAYPTDTERFLILVNPELIWTSQEIGICEEGCLSLPSLQVEVSRPERVGITFLDQKGKKYLWEVGGLVARCLQHEIDHLDGILTVDYLSPMKKAMVSKKLIKIKKHMAELS